MKEKLKKLNIVSILLILFSILFLIYPSRYGIFSIKQTILSLLIISILILLFEKVKIKINVNEKYYFWIILLLSLITRVGIVLLLNSNITQVSDFNSSFINSKNLIFQSVSYRVFTHWIMYPVILNAVYKVFGYSQLVALLTNAFILVLVSILVYKTSSILLKNKKYAFFTSLIYIFWPANILYTLILTQEHLCALLLLSSLYLFLKLDRSNFNFNNKIKQFIAMIVIGICLAFSAFLKNFALVFILAFIIYFVIQILDRKAVKIGSRINILRIIFLIIIFITFTICKNIIYLKIDNIIGEKVVRNIIPCYLNVGFRDDGRYSLYNYEMYFEKMEKYNYNEKKANSEIITELTDYWKNKENKHTIFELLDLKAKIIFSGDERIDWVNSSLEKKNNTKIIEFFEKYVSKINNVIFLVIVVFMTIGIFRFNKEKDLQIFLCYLIIFGSLLLLLLVEAQNRYMYSIQPFICITAFYGYEEFVKFIKEMKKVLQKAINLHK